MTRPAAVPTLMIDNDRVRVTRWDFAPGAETGGHVHGMDYVVTPVTDCHLLLELPGGEEQRVTMPSGQAYTRSVGVEHNVINDGDAPMAFVEVELK